MSDAMNTMHNSSTVACVVSSCLYLLRVNHNRRELNISHLKFYFVKLYGNIGSCWFLGPVMNIGRPCPALKKSAIWAQLHCTPAKVTTRTRHRQGRPMLCAILHPPITPHTIAQILSSFIKLYYIINSGLTTNKGAQRWSALASTYSASKLHPGMEQPNAPHSSGLIAPAMPNENSCDLFLSS